MTTNSQGQTAPPQANMLSVEPEQGGRKSLEKGIGLCLSGGGYRAALFHVGSLLRLNEFGILGNIKRIASVSGGSITSAVLGMNWGSLGFANGVASKQAMEQYLVAPLLQMTSTNIDISSVLWGAIDPWSSSNDRVAAAYDRVLFKGKTLQDLPDEQGGNGPRIVITATNVKTGSLWRFARKYMADYRVGMVKHPTVSLAKAVAASSAFPPVLSPMHLPLDGLTFESNIPANCSEESMRSLRGEALLTDGGVYDNLGLEPVIKKYETVLVSDGGRKMDDDLSSADDWVRHSWRLIELLQHQISNLRRRGLIATFESPTSSQNGTYWGIQTNISDYELDDVLPCPFADTTRIARTGTRLAALEPNAQKRIINWGYAVCDAAIRRHASSVCTVTPPPPPEFPYSIGVKAD